MSKLEKWVVLGVLALIVGILVVSLTVDDPLKKDSVVMAGVDPATPSTSEQPTQPAPSALLNSSVVVAPTPAESAPAVSGLAGAAIPAGSILKATDGLVDSYMPDAKFYTWQAGDSFPILAQRFYGDAARLATLRRLNEGRTDVQPGDRILVPVYDLDAVQPIAASTTHAASPVGAPAVGTAPSAKPSKTAVAAVAPEGKTSSGAARYHVVKEGESLWRIAKQELGAGARWNEIYEANRDVMSSPEALHTGQKLRVP